MRRQDWASRLRQTIAAGTKKVFKYGAHDCAINAARCVDAMTDSQWTETLVYGNARGAVKQLRAEGGLEAAITRRLGTPIPNNNARRGDVCQIDSKTLGICLGPRVAVLTDKGYDYYSLSRVVKHWRV